MNIFILSLLLALPLYACASTNQTASTLYRVNHVYDGDTVLLTSLDHSTSIKFRILDIDAPEYDQAFGLQATRSLTRLCQNVWVKVILRGHDKYQRSLGHLYCRQQDVGLYLAQRGLAWRYQSSSNMDIKAAVDNAKRLKLGLWSQSQPVPPWLWRKR